VPVRRLRAARGPGMLEPKRRARENHPMTANGPARLDPARLLARGLEHHGAGDLDGADALYRELLAAQPDHPDALHLHGVVAHQRGRHQVAVEHIGRAVALRPDNSAYLNNLGEAYRGERRFAEAIACYRRALALDPRNTHALNNLGLALHHLHRFDEAETRFREAIALRPGDAEVRVSLGNVRRDRGDLIAALACYREAIELAPGYPQAHGWLGVTLYELGDGDGAVAALDHATTLAPLDPEAHNNLKRVRWNLDRRAELHDSFRKACRMLPGEPQAHLNLAESLLLNARFEDALEPLARALSLAPDCARAHSLLGRAHEGLGRIDEALHAHERALALDPDDPLLREDYARALLGARRFERAREVLAPAHAMVPRRSGVLAHLCIAMAELGDPELTSLVDHDRFVHARRIEVPEGFPDLESFNAALHAELEAKHRTPNHALEQTMRGGTQTLNNLFQNPGGLVAVLERQIRRVIDDFVASLPRDPQHPFLRYANPDYVFTGAWSTILRGGGYDGSHIHNEGWLSGTYYVRVPPLSPEQQAAGEGHIQFGEPPAPYVSARNAARRTIAPQVGLVVLFPSYYWHGVRSFAGEGLRHSVSYDVV